MVQSQSRSEDATDYISSWCQGLSSLEVCSQRLQLRSLVGGLEPRGNGSCFPGAPIHQGRKWAAFFSPGRAVAEPQLDRERFSKRDPWMALGQCVWELSSGPVPHVSASYVSMGMKRDTNSRAITVILDRLLLISDWCPPTFCWFHLPLRI